MTYTCSNGHWISTPKAIKECLACIHGEPCDGTLKKTRKKRGT